MNTVTLHRRAQKALRGLSNIERERALSAIKRLIETDWNDIVRDRDIRKLRSAEEEKLYSYRSSSRIRLIIRRLGQKSIQIEDIVSHAALHRYFNWREE